MAEATVVQRLNSACKNNIIDEKAMNLADCYRRPLPFLAALLVMLCAENLSAQQSPFFPQPPAAKPDGRGEKEEEGAYNPIKNSYWYNSNPEGYWDAYQQMLAMPTEAEMERPNEKGAVLAGGRSWVAIGPTGWATIRGDAVRRTQGRIRSIRWWQNPATLQWTPVIGSSSGGIYFRWRRTSSSPYRWRNMGRNLPNPAVGAFQIHPTDFRRVIVGTGDWARYAGAGIFRTSDGGETWARATITGSFGETLTPRAVTGMEYGLVNGTTSGQLDTNIIYASTDLGFLKSTDGGATWQRKTVVSGVPQIALNSMAADRRTPGVIYVASTQIPGASGLPGVLPYGVYKSTDGGERWDSSNTGLLPQNALGASLSLAIAPSNSTILYAAISDISPGAGGIYRSTNSGGRWDRVCPIDSLLGYMRAGQGIHVNCIAVHPTNPNTVYAGSVGLIKSTNGGSRWVGIDGGHDDYLFVSFDPANSNQLYIGNDGGIFNRNESTGAISVDVPFLGNSPLQSYGLDIGWSDGGFMISGTQDNGTLRTLSIARETSNGVVANWEHTYGSDGPDDIAIHPNDPNVVYANSWVGSGNFPRWKITERGTNFTETSNGMAMIWMNPITMNKLNTNQAFTADTAWIYYHDGAANRWRRATTAARDYTIATDGSARRIAMNVGTGASVTAYVTFWTTASTVKIYEGTPGSMTRRTVQMPGREPVHTVVSDRWDPNTAYAFTGFGPGQPAKIYRTTDRGVRWDSIDGNLPETINYWDIERNPSNPDMLYVSSDIGVFKTRSGGAFWYPLQQGLPVVGVNQMVYAPSNDGNNRFDTLRISTFGYGFYERLLDRDDPVWIDFTPIISRINLDDSLLRRIIFTGIASTGNTMVATADSGIIARTSNSGRSWEIIEGISKYRINAIAARDCTFIGVGQYGNMVRSTDNGIQWQPVQTATQVDLRTVFMLDSLRGWAAGDIGVILRTEDGGENWYPLTQEKDGEMLTKIHFSDELNGFVVGMDYSYKPPIPIIKRTENGGKTWEYIQDNVLSQFPEITKVALLDGKTGFAIGANGLIAKTSDGGKSWEQKKSGYQKTLFDFHFAPNNDTGWVSGPEGLMLITTDGGETWEQEETSVGIDLPAMAAGDGTVVAVGDSVMIVRAKYILPPAEGGRDYRDTTRGPDGDEARKDTGTTTGVGNYSRLQGAGFALLPAVPNPFGTVTEFSCIIPVPAEIRVEIFDALGRRVRLIDEGMVEAGLYEYLWDGTDDVGNASRDGIYFCRLTAPGGVIAQRVMVVR